MSELSINSTITLQNGVEMPLLGYSTEEHSYNDRTEYEILKDAIEVGFRYFDVSYDDGCLRALKKAIEDSGIPRKDFFVEVKMGIDEVRKAKCSESFNECICQFGEEDGYFDLFSLNWPYYNAFEVIWNGEPNKAKTANGYTYGLQDLYKQNRMRAIGVTNFNISHLEKLIHSEGFEIMPMVNQSHFQPLYTDEPLREYCRKKGIVYGGLFENHPLYKQTKQDYFTDTHRSGELFEVDDRTKKANRDYVAKLTLNNGDRYEQSPYLEELNPRRVKNFFDNCKQITELGKKYGKSNQQILIRWSLQHGVVTTAKTIWREEMEKLIDVFDFSLSDEEMDLIDGLNMDKRIGYNPDYIDF